MATESDPRAVRTREHLVSALYGLASTGHIGMPSVTQICAAAGVTRSAFYSHFATIDDLALFAAARFFEDTEVLDSAARRSGVPAREATTQAIDRLVQHLIDHRQVWTWLLVEASGTIRQRTVDLFTEVVRDTMELTAPEADADAAAQYIAAGTINVLHHRMRDEQPIKSEELAATLLMVLPPFLAD